MALEQRVGGEGLEDEAGGVGVEGLQARVGHRVGQPADPPHQRQRAVGEAVELGQPQGSKSGGHHDHVAAGDQAVGEGLVVAEAHCDRGGAGLGGGGWKAASRLASPLPSSANWAPWPRRRGKASSTRCRPFCSVSRLTTQNSGALAARFKPSALCSAALQAALPVVSSAL